jgi:hypothetical protein
MLVETTEKRGMAQCCSARDLLAHFCRILARQLLDWLLLLGLFNPVVDGLRGLPQASELEKIQKRLKLGRVSLGSLSEASRVFDATLLKPIIEELGCRLQPLARDRRLAEIPQTLTLVDGTLLSALPLLIPAMLLKEHTGSGLVKWRFHRCRQRRHPADRHELARRPRRHHQSDLRVPLAN